VITSPAFRGKRYFVLGLARSGLATVQSLIASGAEVVAWDSSEAAREAVAPLLLAGGAGGGASINDSNSDMPTPNPSRKREGNLSFADPLTIDLSGFDGVIVSPGVPINRHPIADAARAVNVPLIGDIELFAQARASLPSHKVVGITGTNGKSTTTALIHHILQTAGVPSLMGGNIGLPILGRDPLPEGGVYVLELSSYQIDLTYTLDCDVAVLLNITPDHLDRYDGFEGYVASKLRLFAMQSPNHHALIDWKLSYNGLTPDPYAKGQHRWHDIGTLERGQQSKWPTLQGPHNAQNASAAWGVVNLLSIYHDTKLDDLAIFEGFETYPGLPHRMERIRELNGVLYVNDSKATNATSTAPALAAYPKVHWILGGQAKSDELDACAPHYNHVCAAYVIGDAADMFEALLAPHMPVTNAGTLDAAIEAASAVAKNGETVLLSPACASFDQFRDYEARGDAFRAAVEALI
jgi:UDP-N-acetylmuramoylalanine--D-glutamate ligase